MDFPYLSLSRSRFSQLDMIRNGDVARKQAKRYVKGLTRWAAQTWFLSCFGCLSERAQRPFLVPKLIP